MYQALRKWTDQQPALVPLQRLVWKDERDTVLSDSDYMHGSSTQETWSPGPLCLLGFPHMVVQTIWVHSQLLG